MTTSEVAQNVQVLTDSESRLWGIRDQDWERALSVAGGPDTLRRFAGGQSMVQCDDGDYAFDFTLIREDLGRLALSAEVFPTDVDGHPIRGGGRLGSAVVYCTTGGFGGNAWESGRPEAVVQTVSFLLARENNGEFVMLMGLPDWSRDQMLHGGRCLPMRAMRTAYRYIWDSGWNRKVKGVFPSLKEYRVDMPYLFIRTPARLAFERYALRVASVPGVDNTWVMYIGDADWPDRQVISSGFRAMEHEARSIGREMWDETAPQSMFEKPEFLTRPQSVAYRI